MRKDGIEFHSFEWPPCARACKDLNGTGMDGYPSCQSSSHHLKTLRLEGKVERTLLSVI